MTETPSNSSEERVLRPARQLRWVPIIVAVVLVVTFVGFVTGLGESNSKADVRRNGTIRFAGQVGGSKLQQLPIHLAAKSYRELAKDPLWRNRDWNSSLETLRYDIPDILAPVTRTPAMKLAAIGDRQRMRAFDGAPPSIPHSIEQRSEASCLACHGQGMKLGEKVATKISHAILSNCTQCHVESQSGSPASVEVGVKNHFEGLTRIGSGTRALAGSPPSIPHSTSMREDCMSCHGLVARPGIRTTHPWLSQCQQCHARSHPLDITPVQTGPYQHSL